MKNYKEEINNIYRRTASVNLYVSNCVVKRKELINRLTGIKNEIEKTIKKLEEERY